MSEKHYTKAHLWLAAVEEGHMRIGVTDYAQEELGDVVFVELPEVGREGEVDEDVAVVESVKTASDIALPLAGRVVAVNEDLADSPETVNASPEDEGWLFEVAPAQPADPDTLMTAAEYEDYVATLRD